MFNREHTEIKLSPFMMPDGRLCPMNISFVWRCVRMRAPCRRPYIVICNEIDRQRKHRAQTITSRTDSLFPNTPSLQQRRLRNGE